MHTVRGDTGAEAAFHFLSQALSVATQNSSPAVIVSVYIHEFNLNVSEIFLSKQRWGCGAGYLSASIKVCPICLFSSKLLLSSQTYRWYNCMWFFISVPLLNECFTAGGVTHSFQVRKWFFLWSVEVTVLFGGHWIPYLYVCVFFFLSQAKICKLLDAASLSITAVVFLHCINIEAIYVTFFQFYFALMEFQFKGVITAMSARVTFS